MIDFIKNIYNLNNKIQDDLKVLLNDKDYTYIEGCILKEILTLEKINQGELEAFLNIKKSFLSQLIKKLESKKYIVKYKKADKRTNYWCLSELGNEKASEFCKLINNYNSDLLKNISEYNIINSDILFKIMMSNTNN